MTQFLIFIDNLLGHFFKKIKFSTSIKTQELGVFRIFYGALLLFYFLPSWSYLIDVPPGLFRPQILSFANLTNNYLPDLVFISADILAIILILCITIGFFSRFSLILMFIVSSIMYSYSFSFGKIDHYTNLFLFTYPVLAFTNCGTLYAIRKDREISTNTQNRSLAIMGIMIAFGFLTGGLAKLLWIDFNSNTSGFFNWFYEGYFNSQQVKSVSQYVFKIPNHWFEIVDYIIPIFEITGFIFLLKSKKFWVFYLVVASAFHLLNHFILNLNFALNVLSYGIFFIPTVLAYLLKKYDFKSFKLLFLLICFVYSIIRIVLTILNIHFFNFHDYGSHVIFEFIINTILWLSTIACGIFILRRKIN